MRIGSLFSGAGALDRAVEAVFGGTTAWHSEVDPAASKVLAHRWPGTPNLGDITRVDWTQVEPVDVLCGGFPCTDVSAAGKRAGMHGTRSGLWSHMRDAIDALRPPFVIIENVRGLLNANANRPMEPETDALGNRDAQPVLRAIGAVLGDLADIGTYDARWVTVSAASVGAPHRRERVFILATNADDRLHRSQPGGIPRAAQGRERPDPRASGGFTGGGDGTHVHPTRYGWDEGRPEPARLERRSDAAVSGAGPVELLPTPTASDSTPSAQHPDRRKELNPKHSPELAELARHGLLGGDGPVELLPTPAAGNFNDGEDAQQWLARREAVKERLNNGNGMGMPLAIAVQLLPTPRSSDCFGPGLHGDGGMDLRTTVTLLPTPTAGDGMAGGCRTVSDGNGGRRLVDWDDTTRSTGDGGASRLRDVPPLIHGSQWGKYGPAITRWESLTRPAPPPTEPNTKGNPRLSAAFSEWLMGWPAGWVTAVPGISRNDALRIIGNGVVDRCAEVAIRYLLTVSEAAA